MIGPIQNPVWQQWAATALAEGRLSWRVTDAQGRPCNGGDAEPIPLGEWSPTIEDAEISYRGWHTTSDPLRWRGSRVWLVEGDGLVGTERRDKSCWRRIRPLAEVDARRSICQRVQVAAMRADLRGAYLAGAYLLGADLHGADLRGADLSEADLRGAYLEGADLHGADLAGADLAGAYLHRADLREADLRGANLYGAYLRGADLRGADLSRADLSKANLERADLHGANLNGANLEGANLEGANLEGADLEGADLAGWERGPNGYARRVTP